MAFAGLLALLDDIATVLDDVAVMTKVAARKGAAMTDDVALLTKVAAQKSAGVLGDDLALNAQQVTGVASERELPVVWAVAKGSLVNKAILVPLALLISAFAPVLITPLLMLGGAFLCFEGAEKILHKLLHRSHGNGHAAPTTPATPAAQNLLEQIDPELFPIFEEEAAELLPQLREALQRWAGAPSAAASAQARAEVQKLAFTLKSSARLAGVTELGDMAYALEARIESLREADPAASPITLPELLAQCDAMQSVFDTWRQAASGDVGLDIAAPTAPTTPAPSPENAAGHATIAEHAEHTEQDEAAKIKGAVRTDFILSAEIMAIVLGVVDGKPFAQQAIVLVLLAVLMTVAVYGLVACIVKLDDLGLWLAQQRDALRQSLGKAILHAAPWLMKGLSIVGMAAMFMVGGGILVHGAPAIHHAIEGISQQLSGNPANALINTLGNALVGVIAGALIVAVVSAIQRARAHPRGAKGQS